jgi:tetratricopeptide (TPR) repeat protein
MDSNTLTYSYSQQVRLACVRCGAGFDAEVWQLIDASKRPDLINLARDGTLHSFTCPGCGQSIRYVDSFVWIYHLDHSPTLIYSPAPASSENYYTEDFEPVLRLKTQLGDAWHDEWLYATQCVRRYLLPTLLSEGVEAALVKSGQYQMLSEVLSQFMNANSLDLSQQIISEHPELLSKEADNFLEYFKASFYRQGITENEKVIQQHHNLLIRCREIGIDKAYAEIRLGFGAEVSPEIELILREISNTPILSDIPKYVELCRKALELIDVKKNPRLWAKLKVNLSTYLQQSRFGDHVNNRGQAIEAIERALPVLAREGMAVELAEARVNLATSFNLLAKGDLEQNLERWIKICKQALEVVTRKSYPLEYAYIMTNLATAYADRIAGDYAANIEQAIIYYKQAIEVLAFDDSSVEYALAKMNLNRSTQDWHSEVLFSYTEYGHIFSC